jgi:hypothetical protein
MKFPTVPLFLFYVMVQLWMVEGKNQATKAFLEGRSLRHAADRFEIPRTCLLREIVSLDNTKPKGGQTGFTLAEEVPRQQELSGPIHLLACG